MRNNTLDTVKGILIIFVILAHIISKGVLTHSFDYFINTFFMQLFFGVSGYFITKELFHRSVKDIFLKYWFRMIIPFLFAYVLYCLIEQQWLSIFPYPWYHLWFIVALIQMIVYIYILEKLNFNRNILLLLFLSYTVLWIGTYGGNGLNEIYYWMGHKAVYYDLVFFYFGYYLRNQTNLQDQNHWYVLPLFISSAIYIWIFNDHQAINYLYAFIWSLLNLTMIYLVLFNALRYQSLKFPVITWMGRYSLPIYLLYIIPLMLLKPYMEAGKLTSYMHILLYFIGVFVVITIIYKIQNTKFGKILIIGEKV
jgi:fucose 4-O-acetylase-like acetyltransferase